VAITALLCGLSCSFAAPVDHAIGDGEYLDDHDLLPEVKPVRDRQDLASDIRIMQFSWDPAQSSSKATIPATIQLSPATNVVKRTTSHVPAGEYRSYPFECTTSRTFTSLQMSTDEISGLHKEVCDANPEIAVQLTSLTDNIHSLDFCVSSANSRHNPSEQAAQLGVSMTVLQPFADCNVRTAVCVMLNNMQSHGIALNDDVHFWDLLQQLNRLLEDADFGSYGANGKFQVKGASAEKAAVVSLTRWLQRNTAPVPHTN